MASYKYEVVGADGKPKTGTIEAMNMEVASAELKSGGNTIVSIARRIHLCENQSAGLLCAGRVC